MKKILNRQQVEKDIADMWERVSRIPNESDDKQSAINAALSQQQQAMHQLDMQDKVLERIWPVCCKINATNPLEAVEMMVSSVTKEAV